MKKHLCAIDCKNVCRCKLACSKIKKPELYPWLKAERHTYHDNGVEMRAFRVVSCDRYVKDIRSDGRLKGVRIVYQRWSESEIDKLILLYNMKRYTIPKISDIMDRSDMGIKHMIDKLRAEGKIK